MKKLENKEFEKRVKQYQAIYPGKTLFFTGDGNCFLEKSPCIDHAKKSNQEWQEITPDEKPVTESEKGEGLTEEQAKMKLNETEIGDDFDYNLAKELVKLLKLQPISNKKADLLVALDEYKKELDRQNHNS